MKTEMKKLIAQICSAYGCSEKEVIKLIEITSNMNSGAKFAKIVNYSSDKSNHSEIADYTIILNFSYSQMRKDDKKTLATFDVNLVDVNKFNYDSIDLQGVDVNTFKNQVRTCLDNALFEINNPKPNTKESNDEWINDMLVFNWNTNRLSIVGQGQKKEIVIEGEYKKTKSVPKTIAKKLINNQANLRVNKYKRFAIDNLNEIKLQGEICEIQ